MRFNDLLRNREAKAGIIAKLSLWTLRIKPLEHFAQSLLWNARPCVFDNDEHTVFPLARPNADCITFFTETRRVRDQIDKDLRKTSFQTRNHDRLRRQISDKFDAVVTGLLTQILCQIANHMEQIKAFFFFFHQLTIKTRRIGYVAHEAVQTTHVMFNHLQQFFALIFALGNTHRSDSGP